MSADGVTNGGHMERVYYQLNVFGDENTLRACRYLVKTRRNIYIASVVHEAGFVSITLISPEPGPALPYYGQLTRIPAVHRDSVRRFLSAYGAQWDVG